jgi:hypothetical protein
MSTKAEEFMAASLIDRAISLLVNSFRDPRESVSRVNVAMALTNELGGVQTAGVLGASPFARPDVLRTVSEAWQVLEQARLICPELSQTGDWWLLTDAGAQVRESTDAEGEIRLRLQGNV